MTDVSGIPNVLLFSFELETGSREDFSVLHCKPLLVFASDEDYDKVDHLISEFLEVEAGSEEYNDDLDQEVRDLLVSFLKAQGYDSVFKEKINVFVRYE